MLAAQLICGYDAHETESAIKELGSIFSSDK